MLKAGKAAEADGTTAEELKMDQETTADLMTPLLEKVERGRGTRGLEEGILIQTAKARRLKSMQELTRNYAPVQPKQNSKPHQPAEGIKEANLDEKLRPEQAEFRRNKSCIDQIVTLRIIIE
ncbi:unnamed protein product [Trichobilharzia regenti]|nr:unnamed protein product [Trichobilharzia regenti]